MTVGARIIVGPPRVAIAPVAAAASTSQEAEASRCIGMHQASENELCPLPIVGGQGKIFIFLARVLTKGPLKRT